MRVALRLASWLGLSIGLLSLAVSCATPGNVRVTEFGDVSRHRSWDWLLSQGGRADTQTRGDTGLEWKVARELQSGLHELGFRRDRRRPDVLVYFHLGIRRQLVKHNRTKAMEQLSSLHDSPSYLVQASEVEYRYYEIVELRIVLVDSEERRVIWRGVLDGRYPEEFAPHIPEAVSDLVTRIPPPRPSVPVVPRVADRQNDLVRAPVEIERKRSVAELRLDG